MMNNPQRSPRVELLDACLVVEDHCMIRLDLEETLRSFGLKQVHGAATVEAAFTIASSGAIRFAVLDYEVGRTNTIRLAESLAARGIPAVFLTAHGSGVDLPEALSGMEVLSKPYSAELLAEAMQKAVTRMENRLTEDTAQPAFAGPPPAR